MDVLNNVYVWIYQAGIVTLPLFVPTNKKAQFILVTIYKHIFKIKAVH